MENRIFIFYALGNSISNVFFIYIAIIGVIRTIRSGSPLRFTILYTWLIVIGIGSLLFHTTLKWTTQLFDEIPMIFFACQILQSMYYPQNSNHNPIIKYNLIILYSVSTLAGAIYAMYGNPLLHQITFASIIVTCVWRYPQFKKLNIQGMPEELAVIIRKKADQQILKSIATMVTAFVIWNIDNLTCSQLRNIRRSLTGPLVILYPFLQFHAIWHILMVTAADIAIKGLDYISSHTQSQGHKSDPKPPDKFN